MIGGHTVAAQQREVLDVSGSLYLLSVNGVVEMNRQFTFGEPDRRGCISPECPITRHAETQCERFTRICPAIAFLARQLAHPGVKKPGPLGSGLLCVSGVSGGEIAIGKTFLKDRVGNSPVQGSAI